MMARTSARPSREQVPPNKRTNTHEPVKVMATRRHNPVVLSSFLVLVVAILFLPSAAALSSTVETTTAESSAAPTALIHTSSTPDNLTIEHTKELACNRRTQSGDKVLMHYRGTLQSDGSEFDSSYSRNAPFSFRLGNGEVIQGWDEGLLDMCVGEQRKLIIPPSLGYGNRPVGPIPAESVLVFETELVGVYGVDKEDSRGHDIIKPTTLSPAPPITSSNTSVHSPSTASSTPTPQASAPDSGPITVASVFTLQKNECRLLGPFALVVQAALGLIALLSLVFKRWRERPRRPLKVWFFDVSKQVAGTFFLHLANLAMSEFSSGTFDIQGREKEFADASTTDSNGRQPNPCSFYLLNLAIDTTIGIPVLIVLLKVFHGLFAYTPLANPPESIKSGHYGSPPRVSWWMKQSLIYFIGLLGMKLFVLFLFSVLPWLGWVGDWALRWTEGNEALQIAFVMFIFPVCMNALQYYIVDGVIKGKEGDGARDHQGFERVATEESDDSGSRYRSSNESEDEVEEVAVDEEQGKKVTVPTKDLEAQSPTPLPTYDDEEDHVRDEERNGK